MTIDSANDSKILNRTINTNQISNRTYDSKSNQITKLRRSLAIKHPVLDWVKSSFVIFDIRALRRSECPDVKNYK